MLELENVHAYYGESHVLRGVSLNVGKGEVVCLLGRNGAGLHDDYLPDACGSRRGRFSATAVNKDSH